MSQAFAQQLGLKIWKTNVRAQKIDGTTLETYKMVVSTFSMSYKDGRERFFDKSFLLADVKSDVLFRMLFLTSGDSMYSRSAARLRDCPDPSQIHLGAT